MIEHERAGDILTLRLAHGKASALDLELCQALAEGIETAAAERSVRALILTGTGKIFSAGVDLPRLVEGGREYAQPFLEALDACLQALFVFPKPAVAAINGHAIAGGAILAFACDYRIMSSGRIGVPELLVGLPFPPLAAEIVRFGIPPQQLRSTILFGETLDFDKAQAHGLIDESVGIDFLIPRAKEIAMKLADVAPEAFRITKRQMREPYLHNAAHVATTYVDEIDALWSAKESHQRILAYLAKTIGKK